MSLDVYLDLPGAQATSGGGIYVRENGSTVEITRQEWQRRYPGREPVQFTAGEDSGERVYWANITHNLNRMAQEAGIYEPLWRPDEIGITKAAQLIQPLSAGLSRLTTNPEHFQQFNPPNGWGDYEGLVGFTERYLAAAKRYPEADVSVSR